MFCRKCGADGALDKRIANNKKVWFKKDDGRTDTFPSSKSTNRSFRSSSARRGPQFYPSGDMKGMEIPKASVPKSSEAIYTFKRKKAFTICIFASISIVILALFIIGFLSKNATEKLSTIDWIQQIRNDLLSGETKIEQAVAETVQISAKEHDGQLQVTVRAPDICNDLLDWMENVSDDEFTEQALEGEILRLIETTELTESTYILEYAKDEGTIIISYSREIGDAVSCGLVKFYAELTHIVAEELEGSTQ